MDELADLLVRVRSPAGRMTPVLGKPSLNPVPVAQRAGAEGAALTPEAQKRLCHAFFQTGNLSAIARDEGVRYATLLDLARQSWWREEIANLEREAAAQLKVRLSSILDVTLEKLQYRIEEGDMKWYDGELRQVPICGRDLAAIAGVVFDKKMAVEQSQTGFGSAEAKRLSDLAAALRAVPMGEIIDVEPTLGSAPCPGSEGYPGAPSPAGLCPGPESCPDPEGAELCSEGFSCPNQEAAE